MIAGDRVSVSRYHGAIVGTVVSVVPGHVTILAGNARMTVDLSRRVVKVMK